MTCQMIVFVIINVRSEYQFVMIIITRLNYDEVTSYNLLFCIVLMFLWLALPLSLIVSFMLYFDEVDLDVYL